LEAQPEVFGAEVARPGNLIDYALQLGGGDSISLKSLWGPLIKLLEHLFSDRVVSLATIAGDVWAYAPLKTPGFLGSDMVPFHQLAQWLVLSLHGILSEAGVSLRDMHELTALPEHRSGSFMLDMGLISVSDEDFTSASHNTGSEFVVEWRALTVCILDEIATQLQQKLGMTAADLPLYEILQGAIWPLARRLSIAKRGADGKPVIPVRPDLLCF